MALVAYKQLNEKYYINRSKVANMVRLFLKIIAIAKQRLSVFSIAVIYVLVNTSGVFALPAPDIYQQLQWPWYVPGSDCTVGNPTPTTPPGATGPALAHIDITVYSPQKPGSPTGGMEGGYESSIPGPDGVAEVRTLDDVHAGTSNYVTLAGDPSLYRKSYLIPTITYINKSGQSVTLTNVNAYVHDTGGAFTGKPEGRYDLAVGKDYTNAQQERQPFAGTNGIELIPTSGISSGTPGGASASPTPSDSASSSPSCACAPGTGAGAGGVSPNVGKGMNPATQQRFQQILVAAGQKFNVNPNFIASFYYAENSRTGDSTNNADSASPPPVTGNGSWRDPPPPYGHGVGWGRNSFTASGPFQFIDSTWAAYAVDGNGDGVKDVNDLTDATFGAAKLVATNGGTAGASEQKLHDAAFLYNHSETYVQSVINTYKFLATGGQSDTSGTPSCTGGSGDISAYKNPFRDVRNIAEAGIDAGVDYSGDGPVYAVGDAVVTFASSNTGWVGGNYVSYKLKSGPAAGKVIFVAENCTVTLGLKVGSSITADTAVCEMHNSYPYIETGWAKAGGDLPLAYIDKCYYMANPSILFKTSTAYGTNFNDFMKALGAPNASLLPPPITCTLPQGWPTW